MALAGKGLYIKSIIFMQEQVTRCDGPACGKTKGPTNGWYRLLETETEFILFCGRVDITDNRPCFDICSEDCARARLTAWISRKHYRPVTAQESTA
jgi:hypothetical protein